MRSPSEAAAADRSRAPVPSTPFGCRRRRMRALRFCQLVRTIFDRVAAPRLTPTGLA